MELHYHSKLREVPLPFLVLLLSLPGCQCLCVLRAHASGQPTPAWDLWPVILPEIRPQIHGLVAYGTHAALAGPNSPFLRPSRSFSTHFLTNFGSMAKFLRMIWSRDPVLRKKLAQGTPDAIAGSPETAREVKHRCDGWIAGVLAVVVVLAFVQVQRHRPDALDRQGPRAAALCPLLPRVHDPESLPERAGTGSGQPQQCVPWARPRRDPPPLHASCQGAPCARSGDHPSGWSHPVPIRASRAIRASRGQPRPASGLRPARRPPPGSRSGTGPGPAARGHAPPAATAARRRARR